MTDLTRNAGVKLQKSEQLHHADPLALLALGRVYEFGGRKYEKAYNYLGGYDYSLSYDALMRHMMTFWSGEDRDPESGEFHVLHAAFHCLTLASFLIRDIGTDDRPPVHAPVDQVEAVRRIRDETRQQFLEWDGTKCVGPHNRVVTVL